MNRLYKNNNKLRTLKGVPMSVRLFRWVSPQITAFRRQQLAEKRVGITIICALENRVSQKAHSICRILTAFAGKVNAARVKQSLEKGKTTFLPFSLNLPILRLTERVKQRHKII
ncbi:MAG TPA: hypothetical protein H9731_02275 [Candidatus Borkfalkia excrementipullorum]|nr:hypothetical protein [Candidatus Borkfalkia excrementipullorum]